MNDDRMFERDARAWLELGPTTAPRQAVQAALTTIEATTQQRDLRLPWRLPQVTSRTRFALAAAVGVVALVVAGAVLVQRPQALVGNQSPTPPLPSPSPSPLSLQSMWASVGSRPALIGDGSELQAMTIDQAGLRIAIAGHAISSTAIANPAGQLVLKLILQPEAGNGVLGTGMGCFTGDLGTYETSLSPDQQTLTLTATGDACAAREDILAGAWTRWFCPPPSQYAYCDHVSELPPGRYVSSVFGPFGGEGAPGRFAYTVPAGWAQLSQPPTWPGHDTASHLSLSRLDAPDRPAIHILSNSGPVDARSVRDSVTYNGYIPGPNGSIAQIADFLATLPYLSVSGRSPVTIGGLEGVQIDVSLVADFHNRPGAFAPIEIFQASDQSDGIYLDPVGDDFARLIVLDGGDRPEVIEVSAPFQVTLDAQIAQAMPVINSFEFIR